MNNPQKQASDPRISTWLAAHAGTGKTKVLVDRVLRLLLAGEAPSSILCITYTKAAAVVMQLRIRNKLRAWVRMDESLLCGEISALLDQSAAVSEAQIAQARSLLCRMIEDDFGIRVMTIHAFCQSVLARFPIEAGMAPHFQLLDDRSAKELLGEAKQRLLLKAKHERTATELKAAIEYVACRVSDGGFQQLMDELMAEYLNISAMLRHANAEQRVLKDIYRSLGVEPGMTLQQLFDREFSYDPAHLSALREACAILCVGGPNMTKLGNALARWLEQGPALDGVWDYTKAHVTLDNKKRAISSFYTKEFLTHHPDLAQTLDREQDRVLRFITQANHLEVAQFSAALVTIAHGLLAVYQVLKEERSWVDYDDLIAFTLGLFAQEGMADWVMEKMDGQFRHIMLDEAQDTSPLQWSLTHRLVEGFLMSNVTEAGSRSLFVVGDEKQSIYQFQGADPEQFWRSNRHYAEYFAAAELPFQSLSLDCSYRSTQAVLRVVDSTFAHNGFASGVATPIQHQVFRKGQAGSVLLWPLLRKKEQHSRVAWSDEAPSYMQANLAQELCATMVETIRQWLESGRMLASKGRAIGAGDILILVGKRKPFAPLLIAMLKKAGIAVAGSDRLTLNEHLAVQDILSLARWCLLPEDDLSLAEVLKGPWFGYSEDALYGLAYDRGNASLWLRLQEQDTATVAALQEIRHQAFAQTPHDWLLYITETLAGRRSCKARFGEEIDELFDELLHQAMQFEVSHTPSLQSFVAWLLSGDSDIKRELDQTGNAVRVMTVHGAKGLEAPIVMLPVAITRGNPRQSQVWWAGDYQQDWMILAEPPETKSEVIDALKQEKRQLAAQESKRLLYVAMTRAEDELHVCGYSTVEKIPEDSWYEQVRVGMKALPDCQELPDGGLRVACEQAVAVPESVSVPLDAPAPEIPLWTTSKARKEVPRTVWTPSQLPQTDPASHRGEGEDGAEMARIRGTALHRLLEWMPSQEVVIQKSTLVACATRLLSHVSAEEVNELVEEVWRIREHPECACVFSAQAQAEVSVVGHLHASDGTVYTFSGQIDRLIITESEVHIIDFKSNRVIPDKVQDVSRAYIHQLWVYRALLKQTFPQRTLHASLLWTRRPRLMRVPGELLDDYGERALDSLAACA